MSWLVWAKHTRLKRRHEYDSTIRTQGAHRRKQAVARARFTRIPYALIKPNDGQ